MAGRLFVFSAPVFPSLSMPAPDQFSPTRRAMPPEVYCYSQFMLGQKLSIGILCMILHAQGASNSTPPESPAQSQTEELRARIEAAPKLPLEQADLMVRLPKGEELGMVSWLAHDSKTGVTWLI